MNVLVTAPFRSPCFVLVTEEMRVIPSDSQDLREMFLVGMEVVGKTCVSESDDTVCVRETPSP